MHRLLCSKNLVSQRKVSLCYIICDNPLNSTMFAGKRSSDLWVIDLTANDDRDSNLRPIPKDGPNTIISGSVGKWKCHTVDKIVYID
jgi:hypothetical protein